MTTSIYRVARFIWQHYPPSREWGTTVLLNWIAWTNSEGFLGIVKDEDETILGIGIARPIMDVADGFFTDVFDPEGRYIFVDLAIATHPDAFTILVLQLRQRFGERDVLVHRRPRHPAKLIQKPYAALRRAIIQRKTYHHGTIKRS